MPNPVIAIGALSGSGTRVVADILIKSGVYMGDCLNRSLDNLVFTRLFKSPKWYFSASENDVSTRLSLFDKYMSGVAWTPSERNTYFKATQQNETLITDIQAERTRINQRDIGHNSFWGWKEPNTQIFIPRLAKHFAQIKYIQVVRHGLDMAYAKNKEQVRDWGLGVFDIQPPAEFKDIPQVQLDFWIKANNWAIRQGKELLGDNFYLLRYENLYQQPESEIKNLLDFIGVDVSEEKFLALTQIPKKPSSADRYKDEVFQNFREDQLEAVKELGYEIDL